MNQTNSADALNGKYAVTCALVYITPSVIVINNI